VTKVIAIVGASRDVSKISHKAVKTYATLDYTIYPTNPESCRNCRFRVYTSLADLPDKVQGVTIYLPLKNS